MSVVELRKMADSGKFSLITLEYLGRCGEDIPRLYQGKLSLIGHNTVSLLFQNEKGDKGEIRLLSSKLIECDGKVLTFYIPGYRDPTEQELMVLSKWKQIEDGMLSENVYCNTAPEKQEYFESSPYPYMSGFTYRKRCYYERLNKVYDGYVRGAVQFRFEVVGVFTCD